MASNNSINNQALNGFQANGGTINISTDSNAAAVHLGDGAAVKQVTVGSATSTSTTTVQSGSQPLFLLTNNGQITMDSGTGSIGISLDAATTTVAIGGGAGVKSVLIGSNNTSSSTAIQAGSNGVEITTSTSGPIAINSGAGEIDVSTDSFPTTLKIGTGFGVKQVFIGSNTGASVLNLLAGTGGAFLTSTSSPIDIDGGTGTINISHNAFAADLNLGDGNAAKQIVIGNTNAGTTTTINAGGNGINIPQYGAGAVVSNSAGLLSSAGTGISTSGRVLTSTGSSTSPTWQDNASVSMAITGDVGGTTTATPVILTGGTSGAVFTQSGGNTLTESFNFLALPSTTTTNGMIKLNGSRFLHAFNSTGNVFGGVNSGNTTMTATACTAFGGGALTALTSSTNSCGIGNSAGSNLTSGAQNTFVGSSSGLSVTTAADNSYFGFLAGQHATGASNTAVGSGAMGTSSSSTNNHTAIGYGVLKSVTSGSQCTGLGSNCLAAVTTASDVTGSGFNCLTALTTGGDTTAYGSNSLPIETTGRENCSFGRSTMVNANGSTGNVSMGYQSGSAVTTGTYNTSLGHQSLDGTVGMTGTYNVSIGKGSGGGLTGADSSNICINFGGIGGTSNAMYIGSGTGTGLGNLNSVFIAGISGISVTGAAVLISGGNQLGIAVSSARFKDNIQDMDDFSADILNLRPVTFTGKNDETGRVIGGLIAEEVEDVMPNLVLKDQDGLPQTVMYHELPALLLNELQKALKRIDALEAKLGGIDVN